MALTAAYLAIVRINIGGGQSTDEHVETNIAATTAAFELRGGEYGITAVGATFGTATLQVLGADGTTWLTAATAIAANGYATADLAMGQYRWAIA